MKVKELIDSILKNEMSFFEIVQYIETNSTDSSRDLLLSEIYSAFKMKSLDFMFEVKDEDIKDAINQFDHNLEYLYLSDEDKLKIQHFIKEIDNKLTIFNVGGLSKVADPKKLKVIYLNNLMIEYHDGFFQHEIKGFENLSHFKSICESLKEHFKKPKEKIEVQPIQIDYTNYQNDESSDVLIVEELEKRLAIEAVEYKRKLDDEWEKYTFDPMYFDNFISGDLYNEFLKSLYERIKPLNDFEINKHLTLSVNQFKTHTPEKRAEAFKRLYHDTYWFPNYMEYKEETYLSKYAMHVWKHYTNHFHLYKEATINALNDFKSGITTTTKKLSKELKEDFNSLIPQTNKRDYILQLLEDLSITLNGTSILTPRKKGALRGVIEALREKMIIPNIGLSTLCNAFADKINLELKSELDASTTSENYKKQTLEYIKNNPLQHS